MVWESGQRGGATLIELLLVSSIVVIALAASSPLVLNMVRIADHDQAVWQTIQALRSAQSRARGVLNDAPWGVRVASGAITLFQGSSFTDRNTAWDEMTDLPSTITPSGVTEVVFAKARSTPSSTGLITLTHSLLGARWIFVNGAGLAEEIASGTATLSSGRDASLMQSTPTINAGSSATIEVYPRNIGYNKRGVLWFPLSMIPPSATVQSAMLRLKEVQTYGFTRTLNLHRITRAWSEQSVSWASADTSVAWGAAGGDYVASPSANATVQWTGVLKWDIWDVTADIQQMVSGAVANNGWILKDANEDASEAYWYFSSRESTDPPTLTIDYVL